MALYMWTWVAVQRQRVRELVMREDGVVGMEYAVVAAVVIVAVAAALTAGSPTITSIVNAALAKVQRAVGT
jgi:Flp pilus assembly pilin Flp